MTEIERKHRILADLTLMLRNYTRQCSDVLALTLHRDKDRDEYVRITYDNGHTKNICTDCDSEFAMIKDVLKGLS